MRAVLLPAFSLPNQSPAFRKDAVLFLLPPFSTGCAKMVGFPYAHKSRAFERKHGFQKRRLDFWLFSSSRKTSSVGAKSLYLADATNDQLRRSDIQEGG
jgi:hypothetical protein